MIINIMVNGNTNLIIQILSLDMISFKANQYHSVDPTGDESERFVFVTWLKSK